MSGCVITCSPGLIAPGINKSLQSSRGMMRYKVLVNFLLMITACCSLFSDQKKAFDASPDKAIKPMISEAFQQGSEKGFRFVYKNLCRISFLTHGEMLTEGKSKLSLGPYGNFFKTTDPVLLRSTDNEYGTFYLHLKVLHKEGRVYTLHVFTAVSKDKSQGMQYLYFFDDENNSVDPYVFGLNDYLNEEVKSFIRSLQLPDDSIQQLMQLIECPT